MQSTPHEAIDLESSSARPVSWGVSRCQLPMHQSPARALLVTVMRPWCTAQASGPITNTDSLFESNEIVVAGAKASSSPARFITLASALVIGVTFYGVKR